MNLFAPIHLSNMEMLVYGGLLISTVVGFLLAIKLGGNGMGE